MHSGIICNKDSVSVKFPCNQCDYKPTNKGSLLRHIKSIHEGVKFPCDQCDHKATNKGDFIVFLLFFFKIFPYT